MIVLLLTVFFHFTENRYSHQEEKSQAHLDTLPEELAYSLYIVACIKLIEHLIQNCVKHLTLSCIFVFLCGIG